MTWLSRLAGGIWLLPLARVGLKSPLSMLTLGLWCDVQENVGLLVFAPSLEAVLG
jgi:hypothetical protein